MPGQIGWIDLTVPNAETVRDFYQTVTGRKAEILVAAHVDSGRRPATSGDQLGRYSPRFCLMSSFFPASVSAFSTVRR